MSKITKTYTIEITLTIPAGRICNASKHQCRFFQGMGSHPGYYCYLVPESFWPKGGWDATYTKHTKCPGYKASSQPMRGESADVMKRLEAFKLSQAETDDEDDTLEDYAKNQLEVAAQTWHLFCDRCHSPMFPKWKYCPMCGCHFEVRS